MSIKRISTTELLGKYCLLSDRPSKYGLASYSGGLILFDSEEEAENYYEADPNFDGPHDVYQIADDIIFTVAEWGAVHSDYLFQLDKAYMHAHHITLSDEPVAANNDKSIFEQLISLEIATYEAVHLLAESIPDGEATDIDMSEVTPGNTEQVYHDQPIPKRGE